MSQQLQRYDPQQMNDLPRRTRTSFLNYLSGIKSAALIGTQSEEGVDNLAVFNSIVHIGASPMMLGFILRPHSVARHTYENIRATNFYTINHIGTDFIEKAHQTSAKYAAKTSEFTQVGLTPRRSEHPAPYVAESPVQIGLRYREEYRIEANQTILVIGDVVEFWLPETVDAQSGHLDLSGLGAAAISGLDTYHGTEKLASFEYAKPELPPRQK